MIDRRRQRGFFVLDALVALSVTILLMVAVGSAASRSYQSNKALSDRRAATRIAERVLAGEPPTFAGAQVESAELGDGWVSVTVRFGRARAVLTGWEGER